MDSIKHYQKFACMKPWIGSRYQSSSHKKLLVIGESHYLPKDSTIQLDPEAWYQKQQSDLNPEEIKWLSTAKIINHNKDKNFPNKAHGIYRNTAHAINSVSFNYDKPSEAIEHFAYYNFFQRPAEKTGKSIQVSKYDKMVSNEVLNSVITKLNPELVIFVSALAAKHGKTTVQSKNLPFIVTPHPTCAWWNKYAKKYNGKGRDLIPVFLDKYNWMKK